MQVILVAVAMVAFNQEWHVEEERPIGDELPPVDPPGDRGAAHRLQRRSAHSSTGAAPHRGGAKRREARKADGPSPSA